MDLDRRSGRDLDRRRKRRQSRRLTLASLRTVCLATSALCLLGGPPCSILPGALLGLEPRRVDPGPLGFRTSPFGLFAKARLSLGLLEGLKLLGPLAFVIQPLLPTATFVGIRLEGLDPLELPLEDDSGQAVGERGDIELATRLREPLYVPARAANN